MRMNTLLAASLQILRPPVFLLLCHLILPPGSETTRVARGCSINQIGWATGTILDCRCAIPGKS